MCSQVHAFRDARQLVETSLPENQASLHYRCDPMNESSGISRDMTRSGPTIAVIIWRTALWAQTIGRCCVLVRVGESDVQSSPILNTSFLLTLQKCFICSIHHTLCIEPFSLQDCLISSCSYFDNLPLHRLPTRTPQSWLCQFVNHTASSRGNSRDRCRLTLTMS